MIEQLMKDGKIPETRWPSTPQETKKVKYETLNITHQLSLEDILRHVKSIKSVNLMPMEMLDIGENFGQQFGFILYRTSTSVFNKVHLINGLMDRAIIMIDKETVVVQEIGEEIDEGNAENVIKPTYTFNSSVFTPQLKEHHLDILVENMGRMGYGSVMNHVRKGLLGNVSIDDKIHQNWTIYPLDFKESFINQLRDDVNWKESSEPSSTPAMYRAILHVKDQPQDTFINMTDWTKGNVFINGFNLGRYWDVGPQQTLYLPAPFLKVGENELMIFELHSASKTIEFVDKPILNSVFKSKTRKDNETAIHHQRNNIIEHP